jgi:hypothetical protein
MGIVAGRTLQLFIPLVDLPPENCGLVMAVEAEVFRLRDKEKGKGRAMRQMTDPASAGRDRPVDILFRDVEGMAFEAELINRQDELIGTL